VFEHAVAIGCGACQMRRNGGTMLFTQSEDAPRGVGGLGWNAEAILKARRNKAGFAAAS